MKTEITTLGLGGLIFESPNPDKLASFYKELFGIPFELRSHGGLYEHWECDFYNVHFAILKANEMFDGNLVIPSFIVDDIEKLLANKNLELEGEILPLGDESFVARIIDPRWQQDTPMDEK